MITNGSELRRSALELNQNSGESRLFKSLLVWPLRGIVDLQQASHPVPIVCSQSVNVAVG
jgi:hypothetical protein